MLHICLRQHYSMSFDLNMWFLELSIRENFDRAAIHFAVNEDDVLEFASTSPQHPRARDLARVNPLLRRGTLTTSIAKRRSTLSDKTTEKSHSAMNTIKKIVEGKDDQFDSSSTPAHTRAHEHHGTAELTNDSKDARVLREGRTNIGSTATTGDANLDAKHKAEK